MQLCPDNNQILLRLSQESPVMNYIFIHNYFLPCAKNLTGWSVDKERLHNLNGQIGITLEVSAGVSKVRELSENFDTEDIQI